jgi:hypothetical protein
MFIAKTIVLQFWIYFDIEMEQLEWKYVCKRRFVEKICDYYYIYR